MRNPLSAILQCADEISVTLSELRSTESLSEAQATVVDSSIDAAQTVTLCGLHQKRIVDDVLTLSKLDSAMLLVTPVAVQPATVVQRALKMFECQLQNADIVLEFDIHESFHSLRINWVRLDPSRLLQVLINLTTNVRRALRDRNTRPLTNSLYRPSNSPPPRRSGRSSST
jgi:signal transduction histidine kinase